jgi:hypothetical protein
MTVVGASLPAAGSSAATCVGQGRVKSSRVGGRDNRRVSTVYRVGDTDGTIDYYKHFDMELTSLDTEHLLHLLLVPIRTDS